MGSYPSGANGFARVDPRNPDAFAICDRCGQRYNKSDLVWQFDWRGAQLQNLRILVCRRKCLDEPQEQLRSYSPPADPIPVRDPRPDLSIEGNGPTIVTTVAGSSQTLVGADPNRTILQMTVGPPFGIFINPTGGAAAPNDPDTDFYAPGSALQLLGTDAQSAVSYFTTIAGVTLVVQTQDGGVPV